MEEQLPQWLQEHLFTEKCRLELEAEIAEFKLENAKFEAELARREKIKAGKLYIKHNVEYYI